MKILVTGAAGAIGSHLAEALVMRGHDVLGVDAVTDYYHPALKELNISHIEEAGVKVRRLDLAFDNLRDVARDIEAVYHLAAQPGISPMTPFTLYVKNNINATQRLLEALKDVPTLKLFVNCSTSSVYGFRAEGDENCLPNPVSFYGVTKLAAERLTMLYYNTFELPVVSIRLFSVYGERERPEKLYAKLIRHIVSGLEFPLHEGSEHHVRSYTYVGDAVDGFLRLLDRKDAVIGEIFNIGSDIPVTTGEGIKVIEGLLGKKALIKITPPRPGDQFETRANISKAREKLGYQPKTDIQSGLARQVKWYLDKIHQKNITHYF